jgi:CHRD domain/PEP-CTERM motif
MMLFGHFRKRGTAMKFVLPIIAAAALAAAATPAPAATLLSTTLSGLNETTPNPSTATGSGTLLLSNDQNSIDVFLQWAGLTGPATGGHVHCCAFQGANGPVAIDFGPSGVATGSLIRTYDLTLLATYTSGFVSANGGTATSARTAFLNGLLSGRTYYNVHSARYPGGEIRGQLAAVPEPATWGMMIAGFGIIGGAMRLRQRVGVAA